MNKIVFIAVPTAGVAYNGKLNESFIRDVARLHDCYPDCTFLVPMIQDYALLPHLNVEATWAVWGKHCRALIQVCDEVWVMQYPGWDKSVGVTEEMRIALDNGKPVQFLEIFHDTHWPETY